MDARILRSWNEREFATRTSFSFMKMTQSSRTRARRARERVGRLNTVPAGDLAWLFSGARPIAKNFISMFFLIDYLVVLLSNAFVIGTALAHLSQHERSIRSAGNWLC